MRALDGLSSHPASFPGAEAGDSGDGARTWKAKAICPGHACHARHVGHITSCHCWIGDLAHLSLIFLSYPLGCQGRCGSLWRTRHPWTAGKGVVLSLSLKTLPLASDQRDTSGPHWHVSGWERGAGTKAGEDSAVLLRDPGNPCSAPLSRQTDCGVGGGSVEWFARCFLVFTGPPRGPGLSRHGRT